MKKIRVFFDVKFVSEIKKIKEKYVKLAYEVKISKNSFNEKLITYLSKYSLFNFKH